MTITTTPPNPSDTRARITPVEDLGSNLFDDQLLGSAFILESSKLAFFSIEAAWKIMYGRRLSNSNVFNMIAPLVSMGLVGLVHLTETARLRELVRYGYEVKAYNALHTCPEPTAPKAYVAADVVIDILLTPMVTINLLLDGSTLDKTLSTTSSLATLGLVIARQALLQAEAERIVDNIATAPTSCEWTG